MGINVLPITFVSQEFSLLFQRRFTFILSCWRVPIAMPTKLSIFNVASHSFFKSAAFVFEIYSLITSFHIQTKMGKGRQNLNLAQIKFISSRSKVETNPLRTLGRNLTMYFTPFYYGENSPDLIHDSIPFTVFKS